MSPIFAKAFKAYDANNPLTCYDYATLARFNFDITINKMILTEIVAATSSNKTYLKMPDFNIKISENFLDDIGPEIITKDE